MVESSVEDGDMRYTRELLHGFTNAGDINRIVQWSENGERFDIGDHGWGDDNRAGEFATAMHDAVADSGNFFRVENESITE